MLKAYKYRIYPKGEQQQYRRFFLFAILIIILSGIFYYYYALRSVSTYDKVMRAVEAEGSYITKESIVEIEFKENIQKLVIGMDQNKKVHFFFLAETN
ncbi:helix-turn-helix domain-containing protein [Paenibacillus montanisoli]|uniref:Transposase putative helix-turn-helix domain-containing protein n=1 Tax=Paenibacillus montanisoli TaxID=2081970 RepID=A0A328TYW1_9BACL|nr:helix-turn-helix domain-containing protein [Paenibacillus montanisoli]RAP74693.1 hypothetical protein DL346_21870 [Paenibacillus montanisoli]